MRASHFEIFSCDDKLYLHAPRARKELVKVDSNRDRLGGVRAFFRQPTRSPKVVCRSAAERHRSTSELAALRRPLVCRDTADFVDGAPLSD